MKTRKPISTISYNTPSFLVLKLEELVRNKKLTFWAAVPHAPEDDEAGKKYHLHVYMEPSRDIQTDDLKEFFSEIDFRYPNKPRTIMPCHTSKWGDWYLYGLHDPAYLASKGQTRKYSYRDVDMLTSDNDTMRCYIRSIDMTEWTSYQKLMAYVNNDRSFSDAVAGGWIPIQHIAHYEKAFHILKAHAGSTFRGGKQGHDNESQTSDTGLSMPVDVHHSIGLSRVASTWGAAASIGNVDTLTGEVRPEQVPRPQVEYFNEISARLAEYLFSGEAVPDDESEMDKDPSIDIKE